LLFIRDIEKVNASIKRSLRVVKAYDTAQRLKEDQFGYSSQHFVIGLRDEWTQIPTFAGLGDLIVEIQVRTLAQHMWAEASHLLQYKHEETVPASIRRAIYRSSAILEILDLEFDRVLRERDEYRNDSQQIKVDDTLNVDLLEKILDATLPPANKESDEPYAELLAELRYFKIETAGTLQQLLSEQYEYMISDESKTLASAIEANEAHPRNFENMLDRIYSGVYFSHAGLVRGALNGKFGQDRLTKYWLEQEELKEVREDQNDRPDY